MWGGGVAYVASNTATTLTKSGTTSWAEEGFFVSHASRTVTIPGVGTYAYTGGESTTTLTGLVGLPAITVGTPVFQGVVTVTSLTGVTPAITPNIVTTKDNHVWYGYTKSSVILVSNVTDYNDCSFTTPLRKAGEGAKIVLDNNAVGFTQDKKIVTIFAGLDDRYDIEFVMTNDVLSDSVASGLTETVTIDKKIAPGQAAISQSAIIQVKNGVMYFTNEKTLTWLSSFENFFTPQALPISDPIKDDFDSYDLTGVSGVFWGNAAWIAIPAEGLVYIYDFDKALWQAPQTIPVSGFSIIDNVLYGHSNNSNESYRLNTGLKDNGIIIDYVAKFVYRNYGDRYTLKQFDEYFSEVYMSLPTVLTVTHAFEFDGSEGIIPTTIDSKNNKLKFALVQNAGLGKTNLGKTPMGSVATAERVLNKYRAINEMKAQDFFEHQVTYSTDTENAQFEIIAHGPNVILSTQLPVSIKI